MEAIEYQSERQNDSLLELIYCAVWFHQLKWWLTAAGRKDSASRSSPLAMQLCPFQSCENRACCQNSKPGGSILIFNLFSYFPKFLSVYFWMAHSWIGSYFWNCQAKCPWFGPGITSLTVSKGVRCFWNS